MCSQSELMCSLSKYVGGGGFMAAATLAGSDLVGPDEEPTLASR